ncbi:MAG: cell division protein SepF [Chloroflexi bacterium]|nr:cell division protein SepF [Chloroflexota bacterium]
MLDKIRRFFALEEEEVEDRYYSDNEMTTSPSTIDERKPGMELPVPAPSAKKGGNLLSLVPSKKPSIIVLEPTSYAEAIQIAEQLKRKTPVLLNMARADTELARRIIDFLYGINYAEDGHMINVTDHIYLFTPSSIEIRFPGRKDMGKRESFPS